MCQIAIPTRRQLPISFVWDLLRIHDLCSQSHDRVNRCGNFNSRILLASAFRRALRRRSEGFSKYCRFFTSFVRFSFSHSFLNLRSICPADSFCRALIRIAMCLVAFTKTVLSRVLERIADYIASGTCAIHNLWRYKWLRLMHGAISYPE
jgi:hypothetical protein